MNKWLLRISLSLLFLALPSGGLAQSSTSTDWHERIDDYQVDMSVAEDNVATVTETINYNFGTYHRHGIERYIPIKTKDSKGKGKYYYQVQIISVTVDGYPTGLKTDKQAGNFYYARIGDANKLITGAHIYIIKYRVQPVVSLDGPNSYLNWNIIGDKWKVPINNAAGTITFPVGSKITGSRCYTGGAGSSESNCGITPEANKLNIASTKTLESYQGMTINAQIAGHGFTNYLMLNNRPKSYYYPFVGFLVGVGAVFFALVRRFIAYLKQQSVKADQTVIPEYAAPDGLSPGEVGMLNDNKADMIEITATLIDLAVRRYIKIEQTTAKSVFRKAQYKFYSLKRDSKLQPYETTLLDAIFGGTATVNLKDVSGTKVSAAVTGAKQTLRKNLESKGYYLKPHESKSKYAKALKLVAFILLAVTCGFGAAALLNGAESGLVISSLAVAVIGLGLGAAIAVRTKLSASGYKQWAKVEGLKLFLTVTEKDRMKFHNAPKKTPNLFNKLLPYAIALGVEKEWAKQFKGIDLEKSTYWYGGNNMHYGALYLANNLSSDFSSAVVSNFAPPSQSSSSSGFSGGGFSGGGGGGGGGGSW